MAKATLTAIYDANGRLVGVTDPAKIQPVAGDAPVAKATVPVQELKKGLNAPRLAAENDRHAAEMGAAAFRAFASIHGRTAA